LATLPKTSLDQWETFWLLVALQLARLLQFSQYNTATGLLVNATNIHFGGQSLHVCLNKYKQSWDLIFV
jgi:hypothetical protein